jgi:3-methyladenine DNA glycosylase AlkC
MAEPLKNAYGPDIPRRIAAMVAAVHPGFEQRAFLRDALAGYEALELMPRGRHIARALAVHLPRDFEEAARILVASMDAPGEPFAGPMASFLFMPHACFVAEQGLDHFEASMAAQHAITQRFTAEFSIRPFLQRHPERTLERLAEWTRDPSPHVRRLVSEGTRPRLPWAPRLPQFQRDPSPVLRLLEALRDDPEPYVQRSVANNLNDIGKDHPGVLVETCERWMRGAPPSRQWIVRHALRGAVKRGDSRALAVLGFGGGASLEVTEAAITPRRAVVGGRVEIAFTITNPGRAMRRAVVDFRIHYVKANGRTAPKVFKLRTVELAAGEALRVAKTVSLADMTTRRHHAGRHEVEAWIDGRAVPLGAFELRRAERG